MANRNKMKRFDITKMLLLTKVAALCLITACVACSSGTVYSDYRAVENGMWAKTTPLRFDFPDSLKAGNCDLILNIRHDNLYPYRNLWVAVDYLKKGHVVESDTLNVELGDKYGNWHGSGLGKLFQYEDVIKHNIPSDLFDGVVIWHDMRCDTVVNIHDVGISLKTVGQQ